MATSHPTPAKWRVLLDHGPAWRAMRLAGSVTVALGALLFLSVLGAGVYFAVGSLRERFDASLAGGALVSLAFISGLLFYLRLKLLDWFLPMRSYEGAVESLDELRYGLDEGAGTSTKPDAWRFTSSHRQWLIPHEAWKHLRQGELVRVRYLAGTRWVVRLEARDVKA